MAVDALFSPNFRALSARLAGELIMPHQHEYDGARRVWNGMIDKRPAAIARCADGDEVAATVRFAAEHGLPLAVRGGGHNVAGTAVVDDGLVIDMSAMRGVRMGMPWWGLNLAPLNADLGRYFGTEKGVLVD